MSSGLLVCIHVQSRILLKRSKWRANGRPQKAKMGEKKTEEKRWWCRCWREWEECQTNLFTNGFGGCSKVWTAQCLDSLAVIMIESALIDGLGPQDLQSTSVSWMRPLWEYSPLPHIKLSWIPSPSSMIHGYWSCLLTQAGLQSRPSGGTQNNCPLHN